MKQEYYGYLSDEQEQELIEELYSTDDSNTDTVTFPVASWRKPVKLDAAMEYQIASLAYALLRITGADIDEFEQAIKHPEFWAGHRVTHEVEDTDRALNAIHFVKCTCPQSDSVSPETRKEVFRVMVSLLNTFGISGEEATRKLKEDLRATCYP